MNGYNRDSIKKNTSLWIVIGNCRFETLEEEPDSLLYVPILNEVRYDDSDAKLTFYGEMMIACNMSYEVFYSDGIPFTVKPLSLSEGVSESVREISSDLNTTLLPGVNYTARLIYGVNGITEEKRILWPGEEYEEELAEGSRGDGEGASEKEGEGREVKRGGSGSSVIVIVVVVVIVGVALIGLIVVMGYVIVYLRKRIQKLENVEMHAGLIETDLQSLTQD